LIYKGFLSKHTIAHSAQIRKDGNSWEEAMNARAFECQSRPLLAGHGIRGSRLLSWLTSLIVFSKRETKESNTVDRENAFDDYLDSYFNSFDFYPVCSRQVFHRNDAFALWQDFLFVTSDLLISSDRLNSNPKNYLNLKGWTEEDVKARKEQIAREIQSRIAAKKSAQ
jgi:hypothetical protein